MKKKYYYFIFGVCSFIVPVILGEGFYIGKLWLPSFDVSVAMELLIRYVGIMMAGYLFFKGFTYEEDQRNNKN